MENGIPACKATPDNAARTLPLLVGKRKIH